MFLEQQPQPENSFISVLCCNCLAASINVHYKCFAIMRSKEELMNMHRTVHGKMLLLKPNGVCFFSFLYRFI